MPHFLATKQKSSAFSAFSKNQSAEENAPLLCFKRDLENLLDFDNFDKGDNIDKGVSKKSNNDLAQNLAKSGSSLKQNLAIYPKLHSLKSNKLALIPIKTDKTIFFLQEIKRENDLLINGLKITRPTPVECLKSALRNISQDYKTISHNLHANHANKVYANSQFLLSPKELLNRVFYAKSNSPKSATKSPKPNPKSSAKSNAKSHTKYWAKYCAKDFANDSTKPPKIYLEIGFGSGRHILHLAKNNPQDIFIGLEVHTPSIEQVLKNIALQNLRNLFILHFDARVLLEVLPPNSLDCIFLHFPVPWNDSKTRRVFSAHFLELALRALKKDSILELKTDDEIYFKDAITLCENLPKNALDFVAQNAQNEMNNEQENIISKYEARWRRQKKEIFTLQIKSLRKNRAIVLKCRFHFDKNLVKSVLTKQPRLTSLINHKQVFENGFLHISDIFASREMQKISKKPKSKQFAKNRLAFIVKMGDFSQPTSCVIVFEECGKKTKALYLKEPPLPTKATIQAHKRFVKLLEKI